MIENTDIRRDANGAIDVKHYTQRGRALHGVAARGILRNLSATIRRLAKRANRPVDLRPPVPGSTKTP